MTRPLRAYAEIKEPSPPRERQPLNPFNRERQGHRFARSVNESLRMYVRSLPCILAGLVDRDGRPHRCADRVVCCHRKPWGSSGQDDNNMFPGCGGIGGAHAQQEGRTKAFEYHWRIRLAPICRKVTSDCYRQLRGGAC